MKLVQLAFGCTIISPLTYLLIAATLQVPVDVTVVDVDDAVARFERSWYRFDVAENQPGGTAVGRVSAVDDDLEPFNSFHYQLDTPTSEETQNDSGYTCD